MQVNVLDRIKLCDMKLAEGELCHTTRGRSRPMCTSAMTED